MRYLAAAVVVALILVSPAAAAMEGDDWGDPCGGHQPGDSWLDPSGGEWACVQYVWTDGWAYYGIRRAELIG